MLWVAAVRLGLTWGSCRRGPSLWRRGSRIEGLPSAGPQSPAWTWNSFQAKWKLEMLHADRAKLWDYLVWVTNYLSELLCIRKSFDKSKYFTVQIYLERELLCDLWQVWDSCLGLVECHNYKILKEFSLLQLHQIPLQGPVPPRLPQHGLDRHQPLTVSWQGRKSHFRQTWLCTHRNAKSHSVVPYVYISILYISLLADVKKPYF